MKTILAIESSCDETAAAVVEQTADQSIRVLSHVFSTSLDQHRLTGGVVPEVAARAQVDSMIPVISQALTLADLTKPAKTKLDAIAVTQGPGLIGSLLVGVETAKTLSLAWDKPLVPVNHLLGHVYANWIKPTGDKLWQAPQFPALALVVSGGHTEFLIFRNHQEFEFIGGTRDDAVGECFDKCARALNLPYPGGPEISKLAAQFPADHNNQIELPLPLWNDDSYDVSFSGLKAAFVRLVNKLKEANPEVDINQKIQLCQALETSITKVLVQKVTAILDSYQPRSFLLCGGVAANTKLRQSLNQVCDQHQINFYVPDIIYCTDNAAMIGAAAVFNYKSVEPVDLKADPGLKL